MPQINHLRRWVDHARPVAVRRTIEPFAVNSFVGAVDPEFDNLLQTEVETVERLKDRGTF